MTGDPDRFDKARPRIEALMVDLEDMGLTPGEIVSALLATATGLGVALTDPDEVAGTLRMLAGKAERGEYAPSPPDPLN